MWWKKETKTSEAAVSDPAVPTLDVASSASEKPRKQKPIKIVILGSMAVALLAGSAGSAVYFYHAYRTLAHQSAERGEFEVILGALDKIIELPTGETPTLATVTDHTKLASQPFFAQAENGDKVILYQNAKKAFLYRPSTGKLINVESISVQDVAPKPSSVAATPPSQETVAGESVDHDQAAVKDAVNQDATTQMGVARVALYNGTKTSGMTYGFEEAYLNDDTKATVVLRDAAVKKDYQTTIVVALDPTYASLAQQLAASAHATVATMPDGEIVPTDADIAVILGADQR